MPLGGSLPQETLEKKSDKIYKTSPSSLVANVSERKLKHQILQGPSRARMAGPKSVLRQWALQPSVSVHGKLMYERGPRWCVPKEPNHIDRRAEEAVLSV